MTETDTLLDDAKKEKQEALDFIADRKEMIAIHNTTYQKNKQMLEKQLQELVTIRDKCISNELDDLDWLRKLTIDRFPEIWI